MGPRLFSRGKRIGAASSSRTNSLQWGRGCSAAERVRCQGVGPRQSRFNGAAAVQPRKVSRGAPSLIVRARFNGAAAVQPRKDQNGECRVTVAPCFNGAAAVQPRKDLERIGAVTDRAASMGPRLFSRGKRGISPHPGQALIPLQWGRGCSAAESISRERYALSPPCFNGAAAVQPRKVCGGFCRGRRLAASMGPRLFSRGKACDGKGSGRVREASMGPRLFSRGKEVVLEGAGAAWALQWGRGCSAAESTLYPFTSRR